MKSSTAKFAVFAVVVVFFHILFCWNLLRRDGAPPDDVYASVATPSPNCTVKVFVYNQTLLNHARFRASFGHPIQMKTGELSPWLTNSDQHALGGMLISRLLREPQCLVQAHEADVFVVPLLSHKVERKYAEEQDVYAFAPPSIKEALNKSCLQIVHTNWQQDLSPHLNNETAFKHVFVHEDTFEIFGFCRGLTNGHFITQVAANPSLANWMWVFNSIYTNSGIRSQSFAFPSAVHLRRSDVSPSTNPSGIRRRQNQPPWFPSALLDHSRKNLMMLGASMYGTPQASRIRSFLKEACLNYTNSTCSLVTNDHMPNLLGKTLQHMMESTFCLQPPGFGYERKALADAITLGCIPVTFIQSADHVYWTLNWANFRRDSHVLIEWDKLESRRVDLKSTLESISGERVSYMQQQLKFNAWRFHYGYERIHGQRDAFDLLLESIATAARDDLRRQTHLPTDTRSKQDTEL